MFTQGGAVDSYFGNWLYEQILGDRLPPSCVIGPGWSTSSSSTPNVPRSMPRRPAVHVTPGHAPDGAAQVPHVMTGRPTEAVADKGYDWPQNHRWLQQHHIISGIRKRSGPGRPMIERKFAELTVHHRLAQASSRSVAKGDDTSCDDGLRRQRQTSRPPRQSAVDPRLTELRRSESQIMDRSWEPRDRPRAKARHANRDNSVTAST